MHQLKFIIGILFVSLYDDTIYIDNMSGTYKTKGEDVEILKEDLENSFKNLKIELLISPNKNPDVRHKYCSTLNNESVDYHWICKEFKNGGKRVKSRKRCKRKSKKDKNAS